MNLKSEAKIGLIVLGTIIAVIWGINFLKGKNVLKRSEVYYAVYENVSGLENSANIYLNGYKVGLVNNVQFAKDDLNHIVVALAIEHEFKLPEGSTAELYSGLLGNTSIRIIPSNSSGIHEFGDTLISGIEPNLISQLKNDILPLKDYVQNMIVNADSLLASLHNVMNEEFGENIKASIANLKNSSDNLNKQLNPGGNLYNSLESLSSLTSTLALNKGKLDTIFTNMESISDSLAQANVKQTIENLNSSLANTSLLLEKINNGEGSLGLLANNDSLYLNLQSAVKNLDMLLQDLNENPKKYVHFSLFGKKDKSE
jgi:phospholipid/cholesterol/gamma-HCH transport system substrate-binding protein